MNFRSCGLALALCCYCPGAFAQKTVSTGSISGRVTDPQGAVVPGFNLTNRMNVLTMNGTFGTGAYPSSPQAGFGQPTAAAEPRSVQLGVRIGW